MRIGVAVGEMAGPAVGVDDLVAQVCAAEDDGFATAHLANVFGLDALTAASAAGAVTERIELMTSVVPTYSRHPFHMAQQALTTNAVCSGRLALGIGLSHPVVVEDLFGLSYDKPYTHMREYVEVLAPLLRQERVDFEGEQMRVHAELAVPEASAPSLLLAALAPRMLRLCGERSDGTITWMTGPKTLEEHTVPRIRASAERAGRKAPRVVAGFPIAVCDDPREGRAKAAKRFALYGSMPSYRAMLDREGGVEPADIVVVGDESTVNEQLDHLSAIGVTDFLAAIFPVGDDPLRSVRRTRDLLVQRIGRRSSEDAE